MPGHQRLGGAGKTSDPGANTGKAEETLLTPLLAPLHAVRMLPGWVSMVRDQPWGNLHAQLLGDPRALEDSHDYL